MGNRNLLILIGAIVIGLIAVFLANSYFSGVEQRQERVAEEQQLTRIAVATQPLEFGAPLTPENVRLQNFPAASVPEGAFTNLEQLLNGSRVALRPIVPNEPILASKVSGLDGRAVLSANLPEGMRAVSIPVGAVTGVSGFVRPGDVVDVLLTRKIPGEGARAEDLMVDVIMERVPVLAINQTASENATEPQVGKTATIQVDLFQAQKLAIAEKLGTLSLALRNVESDDAEAALTVTSRDIGSGGYYIAARQQPAAPAPTNFYPAAQTQAAPAAGSVSRAITGPSMTIYRGTDGEEYPVGRLGGR
ncbi:Flp pilus assembly protein CpaB [Erythrobacter sp. HKB08]|uniref:Flp pilus assembly protein CpaB n=1 Tax=Erythrobacter sp. HKB08 TaxID=2502843 RepID=UPI001008DE31|nr:Flp pilus assembly protein CpaB [Erythrobacter sp. HKB08]